MQVIFYGDNMRWDDWILAGGWWLVDDIHAVLVKAKELGGDLYQGPLKIAETKRTILGFCTLLASSKKYIKYVVFFRRALKSPSLCKQLQLAG